MLPELDPEIELLIRQSLRRAPAANGTTKPTDTLIVVARGIVADMMTDLLPDIIAGTTETGTVVALLVGEARAALCRAWPRVRLRIEDLDDELPIVIIDADNVLRMSACRIRRLGRRGGSSN